MGIWFLGSALGNIISGLVAGRFDPENLADTPGLYIQIILMTAGPGLLLLLVSKPIKKLMGNIQ